MLRPIAIAFALMCSFAAGHANPISKFYPDTIGKNGSELHKILHKIIKKDHKPLPYSNKGSKNWFTKPAWFDMQDPDVWEALIYTDEGCMPSRPDCPTIRLLYLNTDPQITKANSGSGGNDTWDREHVWPSSRGFPCEKQLGYTDLHHIRPADRNLNQAHRNYGHGEVNGSEKVVMDKDANDLENETEARVDRKMNLFSPPDEAKGQVARMMFYMAVRYEGGDNMPDLRLQNKRWNSGDDESWMGELCTLLDWNMRFKPDAFEHRRNDRVMALQGNRNPFIDNPEWANDIWGSRCNKK